MARQFDIVENRHRAARDLYPFLVILQHDHATSMPSVVVAPVVHSSKNLVSRERFHVSLEIGGDRHVAIIEDLAAVPRSHIGQVAGSADSRRYEITRALDMLFTGV